MGYSGYSVIFKPDYWRASHLGYVPEHIYVAETKVIHRHLKKDEVVHHIDQNRKNNKPENLIVFVSQSAHMRFHNGGKMIPTDEPNVYDCEYVYAEIPCAYCGTMFRPPKPHSKYCCVECANLAMRTIDRPNKRELKKLIIELPIVEIAERYGVSGNAVRRWLMYEGLPHKHKDILKLRERERRKAEKNAVQREMKERIIERDKLKKENSE